MKTLAGSIVVGNSSDRFNTECLRANDADEVEASAPDSDRVDRDRSRKLSGQSAPFARPDKRSRIVSNQMNHSDSRPTSPPPTVASREDSAYSTPKLSCELCGNRHRGKSRKNMGTFFVVDPTPDMSHSQGRTSRSIFRVDSRDRSQNRGPTASESRQSALVYAARHSDRVELVTSAAREGGEEVKVFDVLKPSSLPFKIVNLAWYSGSLDCFTARPGFSRSARPREALPSEKCFLRSTLGPGMKTLAGSVVVGNSSNRFSTDWLASPKALEKYYYEQSLDHASEFIEKLEKELEEYLEHKAQYKKAKEAEPRTLQSVYYSIHYKTISTFQFPESVLISRFGLLVP
ncbi:hypothetical protein F3Y22_tig00110890pilonHSYRG01549 [Hibiscus syriacus]|uniref:Uncharacterized protein n=1 Tax=Hibiscus syriacus TaxID=106335 RepID=A0A6A2ZHK0_HIBSY|nr:hypothetical protein F3Y22_tig00110890pilonHSYRG01549 [Hibiscus syriacus]